MKIRLFIVALLVVGLLIQPYVTNPVIQSWCFRLACLVVLTVSWNLMANAGLISLGHAALWACGGYAGSILLSRAGWPFFIALPCAMAAGSVLGLALAAITGRLRGIYFAISTLSLAEGLQVLTNMLPSLTRGAQGIHLAEGSVPGQSTLEIYANTFAIAAVTISWVLSRGRFHYASRALRNNEDAAQMIAINPMQFRLQVMALSGALAAGAGMINAAYSGYIDPTVAFSLQSTILPQISAVFGGLYTTIGSVLGPIAILGLSEGTRFVAGSLPGAGLLLLGIVLVICVLFMPMGLAGLSIGSGLRRSGAGRRPGLVQQAIDR